METEALDAALAGHPVLCKRGHSLEDEGNVYRYPDGRRSCRLCQRVHNRAYKRSIASCAS